MSGRPGRCSESAPNRIRSIKQVLLALGSSGLVRGGAFSFRSIKLILLSRLLFRHYEYNGLSHTFAIHSINLIHSAPNGALALRIQCFQKLRLRNASDFISLDKTSTSSARQNRLFFLLRQNKYFRRCFIPKHRENQRLSDGCFRSTKLVVRAPFHSQALRIQWFQRLGAFRSINIILSAPASAQLEASER